MFFVGKKEKQPTPHVPASRLRWVPPNVYDINILNSRFEDNLFQDISFRYNLSKEVFINHTTFGKLEL